MSEIGNTSTVAAEITRVLSRQTRQDENKDVSDEKTASVTEGVAPASASADERSTHGAGSGSGLVREKEV